MELNNQRIVSTSHKIRCKDRPLLIYIKDIHGNFWEYIRPSSFNKLVPKHFQHSQFTIQLPKLVSFSKTLIHYKKTLPHRLTLLRLLAKHKENIEILSDFKEKGGGNIILGITRAISDTIQFVEGAGTSLFKAVITGIKTIGNTTEGLIHTSAKGIATVLSSIGLPNLILYIINFLIIAYLVLMRLQPNRLKFLFPSIKHTEHANENRPFTSNCPRHQVELPPPLQPHMPLKFGEPTN